MKRSIPDSYPIDFVIIWVDGSDVNWQKEKASFSGEDKRPSKYRDWGLLRYWFRGVETFAPWVNRVHFVTCGHLPEWLNTEHPKLHIVKHADYIPGKYLPTFSSHPIELNLHRIPGLAEHFSYFNDDMYIISPVKPQDFFVKGIPCDRAVLTVNCVRESWEIQHIRTQNTSLINEKFEFRKTIQENLFKWFSLKYGADLLRNLYLLPCPRFPGFKEEHGNTNLLKSTLEEVWREFPDILDRTCQKKFRTHGDVNQWVFKDWQIASGNFYPVRRKSEFVALTNKNKIYDVKRIVEKQSTKIMCINDCDHLGEIGFQQYKDQLRESFETILWKKSEYERD